MCSRLTRSVRFIWITMLHRVHTYKADAIKQSSMGTN